MSIRFNSKNIASKAIRISATQEGVEVGHAYIFLITNDLHPQPYGLLEDVMVDESQRGNGIGTELIKEAIEVSRKAGCYKVLATSRFSRENVHRLYEKLGFDKNGYDFRLNIQTKKD